MLWTWRRNLSLSLQLHDATRQTKPNPKMNTVDIKSRRAAMTYLRSLDPATAIEIVERSTGKMLMIHSVNGVDFDDYYVTREGDGDEPVTDTDEEEISAAIALR